MHIETKLERINTFQEMLDVLGATPDGKLTKSRAYVDFMGWKTVKIKGFWGDTSTSHLLEKMMLIARKQKYDYTKEERACLKKVEVILSQVDDDLEGKKWKTNFITRFFIWLFNPDARHEKCNNYAFDWEEIRSEGHCLEDYYRLERYREKYGEDPENLESGSRGFNGCFPVYAKETPKLIKV